MAMMGRCLSLAIISVLCFLIFHASESRATEEDINKAVELYYDADFEASKAIFQEIVEKGKDEQRQIAHLYLALIEQAYGNSENANKHIHQLMALNPSFDVSPFENVVTPEFRKQFEEIRSTIDTIPPKVAVTGIGNAYEAGDVINATVEATDNKNLKTIVFSVKKTDFREKWIETGKTAKREISINTKGWASGTYIYNLSAEDERGNAKKIENRFELKPATPELAYLKIISVPPGASVLLDGEDAGNTPNTVKIPSDRKCTIKIRLKGYRIWKKEISPKPGATQKVTANLEKTGGVLIIGSKPSDAEIFLNGLTIGQTPKTTGNLEPGKYEIAIRKKGFGEWKTDVTLEESGSQTVEAELRNLSADAENDYTTGLKYLLGKGVETNNEEAVKWFEKAAEAGFADAQFSLGFCYSKGKGVKRSNAKAVKWFREAAEQGHVDAQYYLGVFYGKGQGGDMDTREAIKWIGKAAEQGLREAQYSLGAHYDLGIGVKKDESEAAKWYLKAAEQGHLRAQRDLGVMYRTGRGVKQDHGEAVKWFRKAADGGDAEAQYNMGIHYSQGLGVNQDHKESRIWFIKAADQGNSVSQYTLGVIYENGIGIEKDKIKAVKWYLKASENGNEDAAKALKRLE